MTDPIVLDPMVQNALAVLEQALLDLRAAADDQQSCSQAGQPDPAAAEMDLLCDALEQLVILAGGSDG